MQLKVWIDFKTLKWSQCPIQVLEGNCKTESIACCLNGLQKCQTYECESI